ncbi:hypothetical protein Adt_30375 [Abeliophyllum distichum]|uniref:Uncharacterized protein n=1 Tax=Abeliophyllum distichum TaxID=126358 RepID=A0ABD1REI9_9LAMI
MKDYGLIIFSSALLWFWVLVFFWILFFFWISGNILYYVALVIHLRYLPMVFFPGHVMRLVLMVVRIIPFRPSHHSVIFVVDHPSFPKVINKEFDRYLTIEHYIELFSKISPISRKGSKEVEDWLVSTKLMTI